MSLEIKTGYMTAAQLDELNKNKSGIIVPTTNTTTVSSSGPKIDINTALSKVGTDIKVTSPKLKPEYKPYTGSDVQSVLNANRTPTNMTTSNNADNGVSAVLDSYRADKKRFLKETINLASMNDADQAAQIQLLAKEFNIAPSLVQSNLDEMKRKSELMKIDFTTLQADSPILAEQLQNITFSSVAYDDIEPLGTIEAAFNFVVDGAANAFTGAANVPTNFKAGNAGTDYGQIGFAILSNGGNFSESDNAEIARLQEIMSKKTSDSWLGDAGYVAGSFYEPLRDAGIKSTGTALTVAGATYLATLPYQGPLAFTPGPEDVLAGGGAAITGMAVAGPTFFTSLAGSAFQIEAGHSYLELRELGATHENAANIAFVVGTTNAALEMVGIKAVTAPWRKAWQGFVQKKVANAMTRRQLVGSVLGNYLAGITVETGTEVLQEITAIMGEEFAKMQDEGIDVESLLASPEGQEELWHRLEEIFRTTARGMSILALPGASIQYASGSTEVSQSQQTTKVFEALSKGAVDSKLVERLPEKAQEFVKAVTKNGSIDTVYIDHEKFNDYLNKRGIDPNSDEAKTYFQDLGITEQLEELAVTGGDVAIPIEKYTTNIANTDHHPDLAPHIRVNQDHWSASESENWVKNNPDYTANIVAIDKEAERIRNLSNNERETNIVYKEVFSQLIGQGTSREDATAQSIMYSAVFEVLGKESNINPAELFEKYGLDIQRVFDEKGKVQPKKELADVVNEIKAATTAPVVKNAPIVPIERTEEELKDGDSVDRKFANAIGFDENYMPSTMEAKTKKARAAKVTPERKVDLLFDELQTSFMMNMRNETLMRQGEPNEVWVNPTIGDDSITQAEEGGDGRYVGMPYPNPEHIVINIGGKQQILDEYKLKKDDSYNANITNQTYQMNSGAQKGAESTIERMGFIDAKGKKTFYTVDQVREALQSQEQAKTIPTKTPMSDLLKMKKVDLQEVASTLRIQVEKTATKATLITRINSAQTGQKQTPLEPIKPDVNNLRRTITYLVNRGGVAADSPFAADLKSQDIKIKGLIPTNSKGQPEQPPTAKGYDNIVPSEFEAATGIMPEETDGYVDIDWLFQRILDENAGLVGLAEEEQVSMDQYNRDLTAYEEELANFEKTTDDVNTELEDAQKSDLESQQYDMVEMVSFLENTLGIDTETMDAPEIEKIIQENVYDEEGKVLDQAAFAGTGLAEVFEKFSTDFIGTGEGNQAYGWGLYFASQKAIAEWYRNKLSKAKGTITKVTKADGTVIEDFSKDSEVYKTWRINGMNIESAIDSAAINLASARALKAQFTPFIDDIDMIDDGILPDGFRFKDSNLLSNKVTIQWIPPANRKSIKFRLNDLINPKDRDWENFIVVSDKGPKDTTRQIKERIEAFIKMEVLSDEDLLSEQAEYNKLAEYADSTWNVKAVEEGKLYEVELAPAEEDYLVWDWSIKDQSKKVKQVIKDLRKQHNMGVSGGVVQGRDVYKHIGYNPDLTGTQNNKIPQRTSEELLRRGIRGIKFADGNTRYTDKPDWNYVIFDDKDVSITQTFNQSVVKDEEILEYVGTNEPLKSMLEYVHIDDLVALRGEFGATYDDSAWANLKESIQNTGGLTDQIRIQVDRFSQTAEIGEGNHRITAAKEMGYKWLPTSVNIFDEKNVRKNKRSDIIPSKDNKVFHPSHDAEGMQRKEWFPSHGKPSKYLSDIRTLPLSATESTLEELIDRKQGKPANAINLAPNGKISNLSPEQYLEVRTTKFKDWFGDWENDAENASKVLDENGEPQVIFHGTTKDFFEFDKTLTTRQSHMGKGFYFTSSEDDAYTNYVGGGPDLTNRISRTAEQIEALEGSAEVEAFAKEHPEVTASEIYDALKQDSRFELDNQVIALAQQIHNEGYNRIINAYLNIRNPFEIDERRFVEQTWNEAYYKDLAKDEVDRNEFSEQGFFDEESYNDAIEEKALEIFYEDYNYEVTGNWGAIADGLIRAGHEFDIDGQKVVIDTVEKFDLFTDGMVSTQDLMNSLRDNNELNSNIEEGNEYLRKALEYAGYDGIDMDAYYEGNKRWNMDDIEPGTRHYIAFDENQPKSATLNNGEFSIINDNIYQQNKRGSIQFRNVGKRNQSTIISLFSAADNSTFLHESGHFFLQVMQDVAESAEASEAIKGDWVKVLKYLGVKSGAEIGTKEHEKWAESFEQYLFEGKAPTIEMQGPFRKFKEWLKNVYTQATGLGIPISDDIRGVFDRLLGTEEEIRLAQQQNEILALFESPETMGFDDKKWQEYQTAVKLAAQEQEDDLDQKKLREVTRQNSKEYQRKIEEMELEVTKEAEAMPIYKAIHYLQNGEDITTKEPIENMPSLKLNTKALKETFGPGILNKIPHRKKMHAKDGTHHEDVAIVFGFDSGLDMITQMQSSQPIKQFIKAQAAERVARDSGALSMNPQKLSEEATKSVAGSKARGHLLKLQMDMTARKAQIPGTPINILKESARLVIASKKVSAIHLKQARLAENRAYKAAQKAILKENWFEANKQVVTQTLNYFIYREAEAALDRVQKDLTYLDKVSKPKYAKKLDRDAIDVIYALLNKVDLRRTTGTLKQKVSKHIEELKAEGIELPTAEAINALMEGEKTHWKDMTFQEWQVFVDSVKSIESVAKYKQKILDQNEKIEFKELVEELVLTARTENSEHINPETGNWRIEDPDFRNTTVKQYFEMQGAFLAAHDKMEFVFEMMDGDKTNGVWWKTFFNRLADAESRETVMNENFITKLTEIFKAKHTDSERRNWKKTVSTRKGKFTKENIIGLALNWGNLENQTALLSGFTAKEKDWGITNNDIEVMLNEHMEAKDWEMVQEVWDLINELWPQIEALQKKITGLVPPKVEATPFKTKFGTMRGGYYPLYYNRKFSDTSHFQYETMENKELYANRPSYARAATKTGHTETRVKNKNKLVRMDLGVLSEHMNNVIHDLTHREAIFYMNRLINNEQIRETIAGVAGTEVLNKIQPWIKRVANPRPPPFDPLEKVLNYANTSATMVAMGFKVTTALVQFFGYSQSVVYLGKGWAWQGLSSFYSNPIEAKKAIFARSPMMRTRTKSLDRDVREAISDITGKDSRMKQVKSKYFYFIGMMDMYVSLPTWTGAYEKSIHEGMTEADAIAQADSAVRMTQSSGMIKDLADIQGREDTLFKTFTKFYSYFSAYWNMSRRTTRLKKKGKITKLQAMEQFMWLSVLPATFAEALLGRGPNRDDDDDNDNLTGWSSWAFIQAATFKFNGLVGIRDAANLLMNPQFGMGSPWQDLFDYSADIPDAMLDIMTGQDNPKDWKALLLGISYITQLPGRQASNMYEHLVEVFDEGEDFSFYELMVSVDKYD